MRAILLVKKVQVKFLSLRLRVEISIIFFTQKSFNKRQLNFNAEAQRKSELNFSPKKPLIFLIGPLCSHCLSGFLNIGSVVLLMHITFFGRYGGNNKGLCMFGDFNLWVLLGAALLNFIIGAVWYSALFGRIWMESSNLKADEMRSRGIGPFIGGFINSFVLALGMAALLYLTDSQTLSDALIVGFVAWFGFFLTTQFSSVNWGGKSLPVFFIDIGYGLISYLAVALFIQFF